MTSNLGEFLVTSVVMELTPGPNMTWLALLSATEGRRAGFGAVAGITLGLALLAIASAAGATALIDRWPLLYEALRWGGVVFLLYLALETWRGEEASSSEQSRTRYFRRGLVVNLLNPKAAAVFMVLIPGFADIESAESQIIWMSVVYVGIATAAHGLIVIFAGTFREFLSRPEREHTVRIVFALILAGVAVWFAFSTVR